MNAKAGRPLEIAIVGMACRFPGARDVVAFWDNILKGRDLTREVPRSRWDPDVFFDPASKSNDRVYCKRGGFLDEPVEFDPASHGIMPLVVEGGEPEQFLVLDAAVAALADAGLAPGVAMGQRVEVVIGRGNYFNRGNLTRLQHGRIIAQTLSLLRDLHPEWTEADFEALRADLKVSLPPFEGATIAGQVTNATAGLVANRLNLKGASYVVDAASASSLVALDLGSRALIERRADLALAGGVYLAVDVDFSMVFSQLGALSRNGEAKPFAKDADGTLPSEGVGMVVLKRRADAERDGDRIYALVQGIGLASDGRGTSLAAPSARGHARAIRRAYRRSGIDPATVGLIEGHGLGVPASDRAELRALHAVFPPSDFAPRALGAVSSMIGHAMPAAGIAGLIKTALALHHRVLPPTLHAESPHPLFDRMKSTLRLNRKTRPWIHGDSAHPRRAGVNAFGFAGINAHAILEEHAPSADGLTPGALPHWETEAFLLGAPDRATWIDLARALVDWLDRAPNQRIALKDLAFTLNTGQPSFPFRVGIVAATAGELRDRLHEVLSRLSEPGCNAIRDARGTYFWEQALAGSRALAFLYPGEGSQYPGMLGDLCLHFPEVRARFDTADRLGRKQAHSRLPSEVLFGGDAEANDDLWAMETAVNVVLSAQWALHTLLSRLGLRPDSVLGHSSGEFLAIAAAGALEVDRRFEDQLGEVGLFFERLVKRDEVPEAMLVAVAANRSHVEAACRELGGNLAIAMDNCPHQVVVAGTPREAGALIERLRAEGVLCEPLPFSRAYHTHAFASALGPVRNFFDAQPISAPKVPIYSCAIAGRMPNDPEAIRRLAVDQWTLPVEFRPTIEAMHDDGVRIFVEVGTRGNLTGFVEDTLRGRPHFAIPANLPRRSSLTQLNHLVASLFAQGVPVQPDLLYARRRPSKIDLAHDLPHEPAKPQLEIGFPELRLSPTLVSALHARFQPAPDVIISLEVPSGISQHTNGSTGFAADDSSSRDGAMLSYLRTMDAFLETQRQVLHAYHSRGETSRDPALFAFPTHGVNGAKNGNGLPAKGTDPRDHSEREFHPPKQAQDEESSQNDSSLAAPFGPNSGPGAEVAKTSRTEALLEQVARRTGYPREMLDIDLDIEGDLGIDSIKRVEILGELQSKGFMPESADLDRLSGCRTLRQVIEAIEPAAGTPAATSPGPWVGTIEHLLPGRELRASRWLDARNDPVAENHTLGGRRVSALDPGPKGLPVLPFTVMAEMIAQAAAVLVPGRMLVALRDVEARRWIKYEEEPFPLELRAECDLSHPDEVRVAIHSKATNDKARGANADVPLVEGTAVFGERREAGPSAPPFALRDARQCRLNAEGIYADQWLFHGPALQAIARIGAASPRGIEGTLRVLPRAGLLRDSDATALLTDPIVLDAFTQLLGCWGLDEFGDGQGDVIFPLRLGELVLYDPVPIEGSDVECRIMVREVTRHRIRIDADFVSPDGRLWMQLTDWQDWRFYWPARYRDLFRAPDRVFIGEPLDLPGLAAADFSQVLAVWVEPPADMTRPVWRDVLEWIQLGPEERDRCRERKGPETTKTHRLFGRIAAKEAARRLWKTQGLDPIYPADLSIEADAGGKPFLRSHGEPGRNDLPAISIAHTEGVALALAALDPNARVGIDVERIVEREAGFEEVAFTDEERHSISSVAGDDRAEWIARFWCAKEAVAKSTGFGLLVGPASVFVVAVDRDSGVLGVSLGTDLANACRDWDQRPIRAVTARRGEVVWAWTLGLRGEL